MVGWRRLAFDNLLRLTELGAKGHRLACATLLGCSKPLEVRRRRHGTRSPATPRLDPCDPATTLCADVTAACGLDLTDTMVANAFAMVQRRQKEGGSPCLLRRSSSLSLFAPPPLLLSCFVHNRGIGPTTPDILLKKPAPEDSNERGPRVSSLLARRDTRGQGGLHSRSGRPTSSCPDGQRLAIDIDHAQRDAERLKCRREPGSVRPCPARAGRRGAADPQLAFVPACRGIRGRIGAGRSSVRSEGDPARSGASLKRRSSTPLPSLRLPRQDRDTTGLSCCLSARSLILAAVSCPSILLTTLRLQSSSSDPRPDTRLHHISRHRRLVASEYWGHSGC